MAPRTSAVKKNTAPTQPGATAAQKLSDATDTRVIEPEVSIFPPQAPIHGKLFINLYQGDFKLSGFQDSTMNTFVIYHKDVIVGVIRGHRRAAISTYGLHISVIARLAINVSEEAASTYLAAAAFFDNNLRAYTAKQPHYVDLQYSYTNPNGQHAGYMFIAGKNVAFDDEIPGDAKEILFRAMAYIKNFTDRYANVENEHDLTLVGTNLSTSLDWK
ncbi:hypothetical protein BIZ83_gp172 [Erwinia phage vB_EamM_ChrisDB]|uniref:hypothetical protein n=1 Tax=Erwinia phage vB_EamM_ChrisDB TaxID=1883371 RepID=UPI00081C352C|nr:hypothetical protein BIZ83_gp172 [Erwinia phage vB_EamM_ChrisDB]ANZ48681.1 hypothetical protein CHRISDB_119 [Erwinia phage vB_EamM_ChrisDB]